jgi:Zn-dependent peptidase ImmA (M78 family)
MVNGRLELARIAASKLLGDIDIAAPFNFPTLDDVAPSDPEQAAAAVRRVWRIPDGPIADLTTHVEAAGAVVLRVDFGTDRIDAAYTHLRGDHRWCFLNTRATDGARVRASLAHEIGHAVMHWDRFDAPTGKDAEREAHKFAAALLLPRRHMQAVFAPSRLSLDDLIPIRQQWRVSIQMLVMRSYELGFISAQERIRLYKQISRRGWLKREPGSVALEHPSVLSEALRIHRTEHRYEDEEMATLAELPSQRLADLMPDDFQTAAPTLRVVSAATRVPPPLPPTLQA